MDLKKMKLSYKLAANKLKSKMHEDEEVKLTQMVRAAGWAAKLGPEYLTKALEIIPQIFNKDLIVGYEHSDDAAVYRINSETALILTLDFFTPIVDDPYLFGLISATNSLSDVYAMGGKPLVAMNIVCFPACKDVGILGQILKGGFDKVQESGAILVGGHSVDDMEPKYGLSVCGIVHPDRVLANSTAKVGDVLVLTKPLGTGIINTGIKAGIIGQQTFDEVVKVMTHLNKYAALAFDEVRVNSATDITGFGFLGHTMEMAKGSEVTIEITASSIPFIGETEELAKSGILPAGVYRNRDFVKNDVHIEGIAEHISDILYDPQTAGGLLVSVPEKDGKTLVEKMLAYGSMDARIVGRVIPKEDKHVIVI